MTAGVLLQPQFDPPGLAVVRSPSKHQQVLHSLQGQLRNSMAALSSSLSHNASTPVPTPIAVASGMVLGALLYVLRRPAAVLDIWDRSSGAKLGSMYRKAYYQSYWQSSQRARLRGPNEER